jgi:hypothetical protein
MSPPEAIEGLSEYERHAQAAAIIGLVERLYDPASREYLAARFGDQTAPGQVETLMVRIFTSIGTGVHGRRGAYRLLLCYFGENIGYRTIRRDLRCRDEVVIGIKKGIYDVLDTIGNRAVAEISDMLSRKGLIDSGERPQYMGSGAKIAGV